MSKIADQVATLEYDLNAALATIDQLTAANSALVSANTSLQRDNVGLQLEVNDMKHYVDDTRVMVDKLASSALELLRASRRHVGPPPIVEKPAPKTDGEKLLALAATSLDAKITSLPETWLAQQAVAEIMAGDSGDEQPALRCMTITDAQGKEIDMKDAPAGAEIHVTVSPTDRFEPLPIFLQRDTAFETPANVRPIFG